MTATESPTIAEELARLTTLRDAAARNCAEAVHNHNDEQARYQAARFAELEERRRTLSDSLTGLDS